MPVKIIAGIVAVTLMLAYVVPAMIKLRDVVLILVIIIGIVLMLVDLWESLQSKSD